MSYCVNCGVELEAGAKKCPLCDTEVINPREHVCMRAPAYPAYTPVPHQKMKKSSVISLITLILLVPDFLSVLSDYSINRAITWSGFVLMSVLCIYFITILPIVMDRHPALCVMLIAASVLMLLLYIEYKTGGEWFLSFALPAVASIAVFIDVMVLLLREKKLRPITAASISMLFIGAFCLLLEFLINATFSVRSFLAWSFYPAATFPVISLALFLVQKNKALCAKLEKKFFL